jgi:anti-sigma regulatory factor (Ser/Thr protein kinase)
MALAIDDPSMAGETRRAATTIAGRIGFDETARGKVALVATEAATNLSKHAIGGVIILQAIDFGTIVGLDILALDKGPGVPDIARCLVDGYSTAGSSGTGLGAMRRLATQFAMHSSPGEGTATLARVFSGSPGPARLEFGSVNLPMAGEESCGDSWAIAEIDGKELVLVVDGLGHGPQAAEAAREAVRVFELRAEEGPAEIIKAAHAAMRSTRGAAMAIAQVDRQRGEVRFAGIGNIAGVILGQGDARSTSLVSHNGTVGHAVRKVQEFVSPWTPTSTLVMHSDGLATRWDLDRYAGLAGRHPGLIAGVLYRDFTRGRDDVTVVVTRENTASPT